MSNPHEQNPIAARFAHIESAYEYHRIVDQEVVPVEDLPVFLKLGGYVTDRVVILNPAVDLLPSEQNSAIAGNEGWRLDPEPNALIIDPEIYDIDKNTGFKGVWQDEPIILGRAPKNRLSRLRPFSDYVSWNHALISETPDGKAIIVKNLNSTNGTFIGKLALNPFEKDLATTARFTDETPPETESPLSDHVYAASIASDKHPDRNEDRFYVNDIDDMYAVFDGVGGYAGGDVASEAAKNSIAHKARIPVSFTSAEAADKYLRSALAGANEAVMKSAPTAATTAVIAKVYEVDNKKYASIAHVGDSRAYLLRDSILKALTTDHTPYRTVEGTDRAKEQQERLAETDSINILSPEDKAAFHDRNVISACLGRGRSLTCDVAHFELRPGDTLVLTSDGIHDNLTSKEIQQLLIDGAHHNQADLLTSAALSRARNVHDRAKEDDMTALVIHV